MNIYIIIYLLLNALSLGITMEKHGKERTGKENFWTSLISFLIILWLLYKAGLFN